MAAWQPSVPTAAVEADVMKRYELVVEKLADANFCECMLARNIESRTPTFNVSAYIKGKVIVQYLIDSDDEPSGLNEIKTEEQAVELMEKILSAHLVKPRGSDAVTVTREPLMLRVHAARKPVDEDTFVRALAEARRKSADVDPQAVRASLKGEVERRDGRQLFYPTGERSVHVSSPKTHPGRFLPSAQYVLQHKPDMTSTYYWYFGLAAAAAFVFITYRLWPPIVQLGIWYVSVTLLLIIIGFSAVQFAIYLVLFTMGFEVWVFPKMFDERFHVVEWVTEPLDAKWSGGNWLLRIGVLGLIVAAGVWVTTLSQGDMAQMSNHSSQFVEELYSGKLLEGAAPSQFGPGGKRIPTFEELQRLAEQEESEGSTNEAPSGAPDDKEEQEKQVEAEANAEELDEAEASMEPPEDESGDEEFAMDDEAKASLEESLMAELARAADESEEEDD